MGDNKNFFVFHPILMKLGVKFTKFHQNWTKNKKVFYYRPFFEFLIHLFVNSLIFANSLLNDSALRLTVG